MKQETPIGERNIENLLSSAYQPETTDPAFVQNVLEHLLFAAHRLADERAKPAPAAQAPADAARLARIHKRLGWAMAAAACIVACALGWYASVRLSEPRSQRKQPVVDAREPVFPAHEPGVGLLPRPRPAAAPAQPLAVGATLATGAAERRRVTLADGSILYLNKNTTVEQAAARRLKVFRGEVYLEVNPAADKNDKFLVSAPGREVTALGTRFAVHVEGDDTGVLVTHGKVQVRNGQAESLIVEAGQQVTAGRQSITQAPRVSHLLEWTRELMAAACTPLVPGSKHAGGALIAIDPNGQEVQLSLRKYIIDVHIEDGFARTTIDQTYFNNQNQRLEGTFYFPLPPDASLSRLAMYVENGKECVLMDGGMAERDHARNVYEEIRYTNRDPALLEWVDGSTFKMRVFPLEARKEKRVLLSYTQRLPMLYGALRYRFPGGHNRASVRDWEFKAVIKNGSKYLVTSESHPGQEAGGRGQEAGDKVRPVMDIRAVGDDYQARAAAKNVKPNQDVTLEMYEVPGQIGLQPKGRVPVVVREQAHLAGFVHEGQQYLMLRFQPNLTSQLKRERRDWVFLFESGANRDPLLARAQIEVVRTLLENAEHDDTFSILTAGTRVRLFDKQAHTPTARGIEEAIKFLEATHLIGALDLEKALRAAQPILAEAQNPYLVHVGAGLAAMGERRDDVLVKLVPANVRYVGVGVGKRWSRAFMKAAAERTHGLFTQINPDEPISWRAFELLATLNTPRLLEIQVLEKGAGKFLTEIVSLSQGEELCAVARMAESASLPNVVTVSGKIDGAPFTKDIAVDNVATGAGYLPRQWAKLEIDRLLAEDSVKNKEEIVKLSKASYVMSPFTSLLVLETEADYAKFKVDRGRKDHWAMYSCPEKIATVYEPDPAWNVEPVKKEEKRTVKDVMASILVRVPAPILAAPDQTRHGITAVNAWEAYFGAYGLPLHEVEFGVELGRQTPLLAYRSLTASNFGSSNSNASTNSGTGFQGISSLGGGSFGMGGTSSLGGQGSVVGDDYELFLEGIMEAPRGMCDLRLIARYDPVGFAWNEYKAKMDTLMVDADIGYRGLRPRVEMDFVQFTGSPLATQSDRLAVLRQLPPQAAAKVEQALARWDPQWLAGTVGGFGRVNKPNVVNQGSSLAGGGNVFTEGILVSRLRLHPAIYRNGQHFELLSFDEDEIPLKTHYPRLNDSLAPEVAMVIKDVYREQRLGVSVGTIDQTNTVVIRSSDAAYQEILRNVVVPMESAAASGFTARGPTRIQTSAGVDPAAVQQAIDALYGRRPTPVGGFGGVPFGFGGFGGIGRQNTTHTLNFKSKEKHGDDLHLRESMFAEENASILYQRPAFSNDSRIFCDLLQYAPGLNADAADVESVLEAELPPAEKIQPGTIDPAARLLIDKARSLGWSCLTLGDKTNPLKFHFNGAGHYRFERTLPSGLVEQVFCDGATLFHLYAEIGLGARRNINRFHRADLADIVPWHVLPAEDLARFCDVKFVDEQTVALVPRVTAGKDAKVKITWQMHLVFAGDGRLSERKLVEMPAGKVLYRETYATDGTIRCQARESATFQLDVIPSTAPDLKPDTSKLVLVPLPLRTRSHVAGRHKDWNGTSYANLDEDTALSLIAADLLTDNGAEAVKALLERFDARGDRRPGLLTLLASSGTSTFNTQLDVHFINPWPFWQLGICTVAEDISCVRRAGDEG